MVFVADGDISVDGTVDASAHQADPGPGGGVSISGGQNDINQGAGGAGGKTAGGDGGTASVDGGGASGGMASGAPGLLMAFIGGASAYQITQSNSKLFGGGGGGGALMLVSCRGSVSVSGTINVGGGGGLGGFSLGNAAVNAFAGGAGGYVVIQGATVSLTGRLFANGGAGGNGRAPSGANGAPGPDGLLSDSMAARPSAGLMGEGRGGAGGVGTTAPTDGLHPTMTGATAGGGGGSVGFLQVYVPRSATPVLTPTAVSPALQPNGSLSLR